MKSRIQVRRALLTAAALLAVVALGCGKTKSVLMADQPPTITLTAAPVDTRDTAFYAYRMDWSGTDPDGRIDHYTYAVDPPAPTLANPRPDTAWVSTTKNELVLFFTCTTPVLGGKKGDPIRAVDFHIFAIRAYDNQGASSPVVSREFYSYTIAPTVTIVAPIPNQTSVARVTPAARFHWTGIDPDGQFTQKPVKYKFKLFAAGETDLPGGQIINAMTDPQNFRHLIVASGFAGWDSVSGDTTTVQYTGLVPNQEYLFVLIGIDEAGAYNADWSGNSNMLDFVVGFAGTLGPKITVFNQFFNFTMPTGGFAPDNASLVQDLEIPAGQLVTFNWSATTTSGADISWYRWRLDGNVDDETPRTNESTDWYHWSQQSLSTTSCTIGPFLTTADHKLYVEAEDNNGLLSLCTIHIQPIVPLMNDPVQGRSLLIVNDTRAEADKFNTNAQQLPTTQTDYTLPWPSAAELDTFLFARGGTPWQPVPGSANYWSNPATHPTYTSTTPPGIFNGYVYDTLGTRQGFEIASAGVPFSVLSTYRHIIWMVDGAGGLNVLAPTDRNQPEGTLRWMNTPPNPNTFSTYAYAGGKIWLMGGAAAYATLIAYNATGNKNNDTKYSVGARQHVFSSDAGENELVPGRMMYDGAHWQSELIYQSTTSSVVKSAAAPQDSNWYRTRWTQGYNFADPNHTPTFALLPAQLRSRGSKTSHLVEDSLPPTRATTSAGQTQFYGSGINAYDAEYLSEDNYIIEDVDPDVINVKAQSVLDTLMDQRGGSTTPAGEEHVTMTWYHGVNSPEFVFSGFAPWAYARRDCQALVDFVMQQLWALPKTAGHMPAYAAQHGGPASVVRPQAITAPVRVRVPVGRATRR